MTPDTYSTALHNFLLQQEKTTEDPDRLFYCSYLLGHLSLAAATGPASTQALDQSVNDSLADAFAVDRLSDADKSGIEALWNEAVSTARN